VEVTDPTHPLFGRRFCLITITRTLQSGAYARVEYRSGNPLVLPLGVTSLSPGPADGRARTKLTPEALAELVAVAGESEAACPSTPARLRRLPVPPGGDGRCPGQRTRAFRPSRTEVAAGADSRARWLASYEDVRRRHLAGEALLAIGRATGLARATVRKYAYAESFPERAVRRPGRSILDPFIAYLEARMAEGCEDAMVLWREVQGQGYAHGPKVVQKWVAENRTGPARRTPRKWLQDAPASAAPGAASGPGPALPSPRQLAWLLVRPATALSPLDAAAVRRAEQDKEAAQVASLARRFTALVQGCGAGQPTHPVAPAADLDTWLAEARACGIGAVETFAAGLQQDGTAVRAALTEPWSSGRAEGQINRLKLLKRQSYGRASFDLLRRRVLMAT